MVSIHVCILRDAARNLLRGLRKTLNFFPIWSMKLERFSLLSIPVEGTVNRPGAVSPKSTGGAVRPRFESLRCIASCVSAFTGVAGADVDFKSLEATLSVEFEKNRRMPAAGLLSVRLRGGWVAWGGWARCTAEVD